MFSYIEKPFTLVDIIADEVVVISDGVNDDSTNYENPTLCFITCSLIGRNLWTHGMRNIFTRASISIYFYLSISGASMISSLHDAETSHISSLSITIPPNSSYSIS